MFPLSRYSLPHSRAPHATERGAGTVLNTGVVAVVLMLLLTLTVLGATMARIASVQAAVDGAALAAADAARGLRAGDPCALATAFLRGEFPESVLGCERSGVVVTVWSDQGFLGFRLRIIARAGPPKN